MANYGDVYHLILQESARYLIYAFTIGDNLILKRLDYDDPFKN